MFGRTAMTIASGLALGGLALVLTPSPAHAGWAAFQNGWDCYTSWYGFPYAGWNDVERVCPFPDTSSTPKSTLHSAAVSVPPTSQPTRIKTCRADWGGLSGACSPELTTYQMLIDISSLKSYWGPDHNSFAYTFITNAAWTLDISNPKAEVHGMIYIGL